MIKSKESGGIKQYWIYMLNSLCNILFCSIDTAFSNGISIDAVVVMGCFVPIEWLCMQLMRMGSFAYQIYQRYEKNCLLLSLCSGMITGILVFSFAVPISYAFDLSDAQRTLLQGVLRLYACCMPMEAISRFIQSYAVYKCYNKLQIVTNIAAYGLIIGTDWLSVTCGWGLYGIVAATELSWLVYLIILVIGCKFWRSDDKLDKSIFAKCLRHAKDLVIARGLGRVANIVLTSYASMMGEFNYAIYSVCLSAISLGEECRDAIVDYSLVRFKASENKKEMRKRVLKQCYIPAVLLPSALSYVALYFSHGKVGFDDCVRYLWLFILPTVIYPFYDTLFAYFMSEHNTKVTMLRGVLNCFWRIPMAFIVHLQCWGVTAYALLFLFDYGSATLTYFSIYKRERELGKSICQGEKL